MAEQPVEKCIHRALAHLGQSVAEAILYYSQTQYGITPEEVAADPAKLGKGLEGIFGTGTPIIIGLILDEAESVKSPPEDLLHFVRGLRAYQEDHFSMRSKEATVYCQPVPIHPLHNKICARRIAEDRCPINHSVAKAMLLLLGDSERKVTCSYLAGHGIGRENVPFAPVEFGRVLRETLGPKADVLLETIRNDIQAMVNSTVNERDCLQCEAAWLA